MDARPDPAEAASAASSTALLANRRRRILTAILVLLLAIPVAGVAYLSNLARIYDSQTTKIDNALPAPEPTAVAKAPPGTVAAAPAVPVPERPTLPMNILVMGSDRREANNSPGAATDQRADTIMLVHVPADGKHVYGISLMRDLWVTIPGYGEAKINAALGLGGVSLVVQTVQSLLNQHIDHVVMMDFEGFRGLTEALGGVDVDIKEPFTSTHDTHQDFPAGINRLKGQRALEFVRERYAFPDGDYRRVRNQQQFLRALVAKTLTGGTLANPLTVHNVVSAAAPFLSVDKGFDAAALGGLAFSLRNIRQQDAVFFTLPTGGDSVSTAGESILLPDAGAIAAVAAALAKDTLAAYVAQISPDAGG
jgi:LCP family protein required for cell wall assembly